MVNGVKIRDGGIVQCPIVTTEAPVFILLADPVQGEVTSFRRKDGRC